MKNCFIRSFFLKFQLPIFLIIYVMTQLTSEKLEEHIQLVKWQNKDPQQKFSLVTVHSLLIDDHPKFIELKKLIQQFNETSGNKLNRPHLQAAFAGKLYRMLCQLVRIPKYELQIDFLNKIYEWASTGQYQPNGGSTRPGSSGKTRPTTATTKGRPFSSYSRPVSGHPNNRQVKNLKFDDQEYIDKLNKQFQMVDFQKLQLGEKQFFQGVRTLHPQYQRPKKLLKDYHRKIFYDQEQDSDKQVVQQEEEVLKQYPVYEIKKIKQIVEQKKQQIMPVLEQVKLENQQQAVQGQAGGQEAQEGGADFGEDVNIDDLPIQGDQELQAQQEEEVVQKLRPKTTVYKDYRFNAKKNKVPLEQGAYNYRQQRMKSQKMFNEERQSRRMLQMWANRKSAHHKNTNKRSQSGRMVGQKFGVLNTVQKIENNFGNANIIDLRSQQIYNTDKTRPKTAFAPKSKSVYQQSIQTAIESMKLNNHINKFQIAEDQKIGSSLTVYAPKPKKKTFEQILRQADAKVHLQAEKQVEDIKLILAKNKVSIPTNKISKIIAFEQPEQYQQDQFAGAITGAGMLKNPFFKVGKKKKKKKKKK